MELHKLSVNQKSLIKSHHFLNRYIRLIDEYQKRPTPFEGEFHHIVPTCIGGTDDKDNIIKLGYREHYIAHYILAKAFSYKGLWFAFNCMRRVCASKSVLYEAARKHISKAISELNTGKKHDKKFRDEVSKRFTGKVTVKDRLGVTSLVSCNDSRYISGELVYYRTGSKHKKSTLEKMVKNSGVVGKKEYHDKNKKSYYLSEHESKDGFTLGSPPDIIKRRLANLRRKGRRLKLVECPYCKTKGKGGNMTRYHFNKCKLYDKN
jgi:hypothetical protein